MISATPSSTPPPIAIFFQVFIAPVVSGGTCSHSVRYALKRLSPSKCNNPYRSRARAHILCYDPDLEKVPIEISLGVPRPVTVGVLLTAPGTSHYRPGPKT